MQQSQGRCSFLFDIDVNEDEPLFVETAEKILDEADIATLNLANGIDTEEIMQRVAAVAENGRSP